MPEKVCANGYERCGVCYSDGYRHAIRDIADRVKELREDFEDPTGDCAPYYRAEFVVEMLLDMAFRAPEGPPDRDEDHEKPAQHALGETQITTKKSEET